MKHSAKNNVKKTLTRFTFMEGTSIKVHPLHFPYKDGILHILWYTFCVIKIFSYLCSPNKVNRR